MIFLILAYLKMITHCVFFLFWDSQENMSLKYSNASNRFSVTKIDLSITFFVNKDFNIQDS